MKFFKNDFAAVSLFLAVLLFTPRLLPNEYYVSVLILAMLHALIAVGLNLLMGYAGQISLGHAGFYGLGAYTSAILTTKYGYAIWEGMIAGIVFVAIVAYIIGIPTLKLRGHYLAMGTLGFGIILSIVFNEWIDMTDGPNGMVGIERLTLFGYSFDSDESLLLPCGGGIVADHLHFIQPDKFTDRQGASSASYQRESRHGCRD